MKVTDQRSGVTIEFPDGTDPDVIDQAMREAIAGTSGPEPPVGADMLKGLGAGAVRGIAGIGGMQGDVNQLATTAVKWGADKLGYPLGDEFKMEVPITPQAIVGPMLRTLGVNIPPPPTTNDIVGAVEENLTGELYEPQTRMGKYARTLGEFAPGALGGPGGIMRRSVEQAILPALGSEAAGQATEGTALEPYARVAGAVGGGSARRIISPAPPSPVRQQMVDTLQAEGVQPTAGQASGSKGLQYFESEMGGMQTANRLEAQGEQFTSAALRRAGIQGQNRALPDVVNQAFIDQGQRFDDLAARTSVPLDQQLQNDLLNVVTDYADLGGAAPIVEGMMNHIAQTAGRTGNVLRGEAYKRIRTRIGEIMQNADSSTKLALREIQESLDDAVERHAPQNLRREWQQARREYRNLLVIERAAVGGGEQAGMGIISPARLRMAAAGQNHRAYVRGRDDFSDIAHAGQSLLTPLPESGTAARLGARGVSGSLTGTAAMMLTGDPAAGVGSFMAGAALPRGLGYLAMSDPGQRYLMNRILGQPGLPASMQAFLYGPRLIANQQNQ